MANSHDPTSAPFALEWRTHFEPRRPEPVTEASLDYLLDADDRLGVAARALVRILPAEPTVARIAERNGLAYSETADILASMRIAVARAEGGAA